MSSFVQDSESSLARLLALIPPPESPRHVESGTVAKDEFRGLPQDLVDLVLRYGSGEFSHRRFGCLVSPYNPLAPRYSQGIDEEHAILAQHRKAEGDSKIPHPVYPQSPGLRLWGDNDKGDLFLWLTEGEPDVWPVMYFGDMRTMVRFDMPVVVFLERLFTGQIARTELGYALDSDDRLDPAEISFVPRGNH